MQNNTNDNSFCQQPTPFERINYYFGKMMTVRDFTDEQQYMNEKRWMLNRLGLGWGVLCGLKVEHHPDIRNKVIIKPGLALDQYGNEIKICQAHEVDLCTAQDDPPDPQPGDPPEMEYWYYVSVKYHECETEPAPVPVDDCGEHQAECFYNRTRETYELIVTRTAPNNDGFLNPGLPEPFECEVDCSRFLHNPEPIISRGCPTREKCTLVPLARVCYNTGDDSIPPLHIDNGYRKILPSNEILFELLRCFRQELKPAHSAKQDRRRFVPLLANTIKGVEYQNGKMAEVEIAANPPDEPNIQPQRLTSDGTFAWFTDSVTNRIRRIDRRGDEMAVLNEEALCLHAPAWGIAFDGKYMWVTHPDSQVPEGGDGDPIGEITRIDTCTLETWKIDSLPQCDSLQPCQINGPSSPAGNPINLPPFPKEIVFHKGQNSLSHGLRVDPISPNSNTIFRFVPG